MKYSDLVLHGKYDGRLILPARRRNVIANHKKSGNITGLILNVGFNCLELVELFCQTTRHRCQAGIPGCHLRGLSGTRDLLGRDIGEMTGQPASNDKFALYGVLNPLTGETFSAAYPKGKSEYTEAFLERVLAQFEGSVLLIWDHASWHTSQMVEKVVSAYERLGVLLLPKRAPQENPMEDLWRHLKQIVAANLERDLEVLKAACHAFFEQLTNRDALRMAGLAA